MKQKSLGSITNSILVKKHLDDMHFIEDHAFSDFFTNIFATLAITLFAFTTILVNKMDPSVIGKYPNYLLLYLQHFANPLLLTGSVMVLHYVRHPPLRASLLREAKAQFWTFN
jgi:hypothetical protein